MSSHDIWGGRLDSNQRLPEPQSGVLPTELHPPFLIRHMPLKVIAHMSYSTSTLRWNRLIIQRTKRITDAFVATPNIIVRKAGLEPAVSCVQNKRITNFPIS